MSTQALKKNDTGVGAPKLACGQRIVFTDSLADLAEALFGKQTAVCTICDKHSYDDGICEYCCSDVMDNMGLCTTCFTEIDTNDCCKFRCNCFHVDHPSVQARRQYTLAEVRALSRIPYAQRPKKGKVAQVPRQNRMSTYAVARVYFIGLGEQNYSAILHSWKEVCEHIVENESRLWEGGKKKDAKLKAAKLMDALGDEGDEEDFIDTSELFHDDYHHGWVIIRSP